MIACVRGQDPGQPGLVGRRFRLECPHPRPEGSGRLAHAGPLAARQIRRTVATQAGETGHIFAEYPVSLLFFDLSVAGFGRGVNTSIMAQSTMRIPYCATGNELSCTIPGIESISTTARLLAARPSRVSLESAKQSMQ